MKISVYTCDYPCAIDRYNIATLVNTLSKEMGYEVTIVRVRSPQISAPLVKTFFRKASNFSFNKLRLLIDDKALERRISQMVPRWDETLVSTTFVESVNGTDAEKVLRRISPDIIVQAGAGILKSNIFNTARIATLNVHHGIAPEIRGMCSTLWVLYCGLVDSIGVTCHVIEETLDTGPVVLQYKYPYQKGDAYSDIQVKLVEEGANLLVSSIQLLKDREMKVQSQDVRSFYFSAFHADHYAQLRKNKFMPVVGSQSLRTKMKSKRTCIW